MEYHNKQIENIILELNSNLKGLTDKEVLKKQKESGYNELIKIKKNIALEIFLNQIKNGLMILLLIAFLLSFLLGHTLEAFAIIAIMLLNITIGFIQEYSAEKAVESLKKMSAQYARVIRNNNEIKIFAKDIVVGDIIIIESGDIIPADARLIEVRSLQIDESTLTGESVNSKKTNQIIKNVKAISDQTNMIFSGTIVTYGKGTAIVTAIGMNTEIGKIAKSIDDTIEEKSPLLKKFEIIAKKISYIALSLVLLVFMIGILNKSLSLTQMIFFALTLTVSTIPNALPVIVTIGLSFGRKRLAKKNMIIKKLPAAESLGATTIICSDKTGTITKNEMTVTRIYYNDIIIDVTGSGYNTSGNFIHKNKKINPEDLEIIFKIGYLCNNAKLNDNKIIGDPTEGALLVLAKKGKLKDIKKDLQLIEELPFDSDRKRMSVIYKNKNKIECYTKGAPDLLIEKCNRILIDGKVRKINNSDILKIKKASNQFGNDALRVLGFAYREVKNNEKYTIQNIENNLIFVSLCAMIDPPREEVISAIEKCKIANIKVMIITGDHIDTTKAIARKINLYEDKDIAITGKELDKLSDSELTKIIDNIKIIARAMPIQKSRIVEILQKKGHIVAVTGDGVNDGPALKKADIGIAMGITGSDIAKEVSKATLVDDNFATIVNAIAEGRNIYDKIIRSTKYLLSCNSGEIFSVLIAVTLSFPMPLLPLQLLVMNLLTDAIPALGLGFEKANDKIMNRPPRNPKEAPISNRLLISIIFFGLIMGSITIYMFNQYQYAGLIKAQTIAFTTLVMIQMFAIISARSNESDIKTLNPFTNLFLTTGIIISILIQIAIIYNPMLQQIFGTTSLELIDWIKIIVISFIGFIFMEISKYFLTSEYDYKIITTK